MYEGFARVYDRLMTDAPYGQIAALFDGVVRETGVVPGVVLDLGCGTGALFDHLLKSARRVIGVDPSEAMLSEAAERHAARLSRLTLIQGRAEELAVPECADACIAALDVVNYAQGYAELAAWFRSVRRAVRPGGFFLFDTHSRRKALDVLRDNVFYDIGDDIAAVMRTTCDPRGKEVTYELTIFAANGKGLYARTDETHRQWVHSVEEIESALESSGFHQVQVGADLTFRLPAHEGLSETGFSIVRRASDEEMDLAMRWCFLAR